ncbi:MAG: CehA/McbA family metallohydrolase [Gemmataceae bacterium]
MPRTLAFLFVLTTTFLVAAADWPAAKEVEAQPLLAQVRRLGQRSTTSASRCRQRFAALAAVRVDDADAATKVQALDPLCLAAVEVGPRGVTQVVPTGRKPELVEQGWRAYLVKVVNKGELTGPLRVDSPNARPVPNAPKEQVAERWLGLLPFTAQPLLPNLSGLKLEYTVVQLFSRDAGERTAEIGFRVGAGPKAVERRARFTFVARPSVPVTFEVAEFDGTPTTAAFLIRDAAGRVYPAQQKRLAPDFFFHPQVYRSTGETVRLPAGTYTVVCSRGPESVPETKELVVGDGSARLRYTVRRWIDPAKRGWWSGDHHIHAAGCQHYENPTEGVEPSDMMRHVLGEDLKVGCCLTWGPCFDYQKRFFTGRPDDVSRPPYLLRYDVEVSGFGSHVSGHLNLLNLKVQIPPGGLSKNHWPTLGMNTLRWAKRQGAVCGPAHSGNGLTRFVGRIPGATDGPGGLPHYHIPAYDGIGANEFIVDVAHEVPGGDGKPTPAVDFISAMDTDRIAEWTMWYHVLNCGFRVRASGETDFPCITGDRVGAGRVYARVDGELTFEKWVKSIADGRSYVSDGTTHLMDLTAAVGDRTYDLGVKGSEIALAEPGRVTLTVQAATRLPNRKTVPVELVVNGLPVERREMPCDGKTRELRFTADLKASSWVAVRVTPSAHTNPFFVLVGGKPIRASRHSAEWCLAGVEQCWKTKASTYRAAEQAQAAADYDHARTVYRRLIAESPR